MFRRIGEATLGMVAGMGRGFLMLCGVVCNLQATWKRHREVIEQMHILVIGSLPLVATTAAFTGAITAVQTGYQMKAYVPMIFLGTVVTKSVILEMGPVLAALVVGSRLSANYAAELGTMKVTEQLDAMEIMAIEPIQYLGLPRFVAAVLMMPVITVIADLIAILGGLVVSVITLDVTVQTFAEGMRMFWTVGDVITGVGKTFFFGGIIAMSGIYHGFNTQGGAEGVGRATMQAVVGTCLSVLIADYLLNTVFMQIIFKG
ncbi:MAG TPA: ABC transporter permease [Candidatus Krumholzibacteria bacterium]|nr:ABC transporter permease [Candidatus Krumholzibacteria bacterium]HPD71980.1 ABC transporter permease [Candidatus Krumholzibacteria bacterium]HRY41087.1 ABC transporter permease [Candidatus Krumholzibacteria bacterium]